MSQQRQNEQFALLIREQQIEHKEAMSRYEEMQNKHLEIQKLTLEKLNNNQANEGNSSYSNNTIFNSLETFNYVPDEEKTFEAYFKRYERYFLHRL